MKLFCDLDGTLIDVSIRHYKVYAEVTEALGGHVLAQAVYWDLKRKKTKWNKLLPMSGLSPDVEAEFLNMFIHKIEAEEYLKLDTFFPKALEALDRLHRRYDCYLVSLRRNEKNLLDQLAWLGIRSHFKEVLTGHSESDGHDVKIALIRNILKKDQGIIIGDTEADIIAGQELGLQTLAVTSGIRDEQFLRALHPDVLGFGIDDVVRLL